MRKRILSTILALVLVFSVVPAAVAADKEPTASQKYVEAMGQGWNLGNTFDGVDTDLSKEDLGEEAWGNPIVTRELIHAVKAKGYDSIRMPLTLYHRYTETGGKAVIDTEWLARYKEVVDWAVEEGLYVMVNIHHDSWIWLNSWDGKEGSAEYVRFVQLWEQLADYMKDEPEQVCFETINEPQFNDGSDDEKQEKLDKLNLAAYRTIRESGGNNAARMIVLPTLNTNHEKCAPLLKLIQGLDDENVIATVHYYSEWVYSANLGITGFDEVMGDDGNTARKAADRAMAMVDEAFIQNGIGVVIGEYGLLGYDAGDECNQPGEELKYYEYMNELARKYGLCLIFWDNGSGIDRRSGDFQWKKPLVGAMLEASMKGRSSYTTELDTLYFTEKVTEDVPLALTLNGNTFNGIEGLTEGTEYTYDPEKAVVTLKADYINKLFDSKDGCGDLAVLTLNFSSGADWQETLVKCAAPVFSTASGTASEGLVIPVTYNGAELRRITAYAGEDRTGPQSSWWKYLQHTETFLPDYKNGTLTMKPSFFNECAEGQIKLVIEFYNGQTAEVTFNKNGDQITMSDMADVPVTPAVPSFSDVQDGAWYQEAVDYVVSRGIMDGVTADRFAPDSTLTHAQMIQILHNMEGAADFSAPAESDADVTRAAAADFLYQYAASQGKATLAGNLSAYADAGDISKAEFAAVSWAVGQGIITGTSATTLEPNVPATRAEIAAMIMRYCEIH